MTTDTANPTANSGASNPSPLAAIENFLAAQDGDTDQPQTNDSTQADDESAKAANPTDSPTDDATGEDSEPQITTSQLAKMLGVDESLIDVDADGAPVFKTKIDGKESAAKFQDFLKTHQLQGHAENRVREAAEKEKAAERKMQEADQAVQAKLQEQQQSLQQIFQMNAILQEELRGEYQAINWDALWQQDPAQARSLERRFDARQQRINGVFQTLQQRNAQANQQAEQQRKANEESNSRKQAERLTTLIPEWKDASVFQKERGEILGWVDKAGFDVSEFDLNKASHVAALRQLWQHATLQASKPEIEKKVREAPKLVKPGQAPRTDANTVNLKGLKQNIRNASTAQSAKAMTDFLLRSGLA